MTNVFLEATLAQAGAILAQAPRTGRRKRNRFRAARRPAFTPNPATTRAMVEAGISEADAVTLQEGDAHERRSAAAWGDPARLSPHVSPALDRAARIMAEAVESTGTSSAMAMPSGWT